MRNHSIAVLREIGVETGGSNVQWAVNPADGRMVVIEMNPRVSRSSALASKATGFPIAKIAAVGEAMSIGRTIHESMQKALASMETGLTGFDEIEIDGMPGTDAVQWQATTDDIIPRIVVGKTATAQDAIDKTLTRERPAATSMTSAKPARTSAWSPVSNASTPAPRSSRRRPPTCTPPTRPR